ncbi:hypothetical protein ACSBR1_036969 [Camellia fascicularis]
MEKTDSSKEVSIKIDKLSKLLACSLKNKLLHESPSLSENSIFRFPRTLRQHNESIYEPKIVSIGPYHRGKDRLAPMENIKLWLLGHPPSPVTPSSRRNLATINRMHSQTSEKNNQLLCRKG